MNRYICEDLSDLRKYQKYIWCSYETDFTGDIKASTNRNESLWATTRKRLIEMIRIQFIKDNLNDNIKKEYSEEKFQDFVSEFQKMINFFESTKGGAIYNMTNCWSWHHIKKIYIDELE